MLSKRDNLIDNLRFIAIVLMIFAHTNMILNISFSPINNLLQNLGNFICFGLFLFCFGASSRIQYDQGKKNTQKLFKRISLLYLAYMIATIIALLDEKNFSVLNFWSYNFFYKLPPYGEFIAAFIILEVLYFIFGNHFNEIAKNKNILILVSLSTFYIGNFLKDFDFSFFTPYTILLWGGDNKFSFPIFQYLALFLLGIFYVENKEKSGFKTSNRISFILSIVLFFLLLIVNYFPNRWSPNISFLLGNLSILLFFTSFPIVFSQLGKKVEFIEKIIRTINKYTIHILYSHLLILFILRWLNFIYSPIWTYIVTLAVLGLFLLIEKFKIQNEKFSWT